MPGGHRSTSIAGAVTIDKEDARPLHPASSACTAEKAVRAGVATSCDSALLECQGYHHPTGSAPVRTEANAVQPAAAEPAVQAFQSAKGVRASDLRLLRRSPGVCGPDPPCAAKSQCLDCGSRGCQSMPLQVHHPSGALVFRCRHFGLASERICQQPAMQLVWLQSL